MKHAYLLLTRFLFVGFICLFSTTAVFAEDDSEDDEEEVIFQPSTVNHLARDEVSVRLEPLGFGLMGDTVDPYTGTLVFNHTDVSLPGNSNLEVAIRRMASTAQMTNMQEMFFGDWILDIPNISSLDGGGGGKFSCLENEGDSVTEGAYLGGHIGGQSREISIEAYWDGLKLNIPGQGAKTLIENGYGDPFSRTAWGTFGDTDTKSGGLARVTKDHWIVTCLTKQVSSRGRVHTVDNGYIAISPDGTKYSMDRKITMPADDYVDNHGYVLKRNIGKYYATQVTDIHGNWVKYEFSSDDKLTRIHSNDGREITLSYIPGTDNISTVTANGRTWQYVYQEVNRTIYGKFMGSVLHKVIQPDGTYWEFNLEFLTLNKPTRGYCDLNLPPESVETYMKHPYGVRADYEIAQVRHALTSFDSFPIRGFIPKTFTCSDGTTYTPAGNSTFRRTISVVKKTLSGPSIPVSVWNYDYEEYLQGQNFSGGTTKTTTTTDPIGRKTVSHFYTTRDQSNNGTSVFDGKLLKQQRYSVDNVLLEDTEHNYIPSNQFGEIEALGFGRGSSQLFDTYKTKTVTKRDGDTFIREYVYNIDQNSSNYSYGQLQPLRVNQSTRLFTVKIIGC